MSPEDEPRSTKDIIRDLLEFAQEHEWVMEMTTCGHGCCHKWETHCPSCGEEKGPDAKHKPDCRLAATIKEAEAYLAVEYEIEHRREYGEALPSDPA